MAKEEVTTNLIANPALTITASDVAALLAMGEDRAISGPIELPGGVTGFIIPNEMRLIEKAPVNPVLPDGVKQAEEMVEPASFKDYLTQFKSSTAICRASLSANKIVAVLDYHGRAREGDRDTATPGLGQHVVTLNCPFDVDYAKWRARFGKFLDQKAMLEFIEEMIHTIAMPPAADLLEAMGDIEIERVVRFKSARNDRNGNVSIGYEEKDGEQTRQGVFTLPESVDIVVPIFQGGNAVQLTAKLRIRMKDGNLSLGLAVPGIEVKEREAFRSIGEDVRAATNTPVFYTA
jgi:hypothetical protein